MKNNLIFRAPSSPESGYKKLIEKVFYILDRNFDLVCESLGDDRHSLFANKKKLNSQNFNEKELIITTLTLDRYSSLVNTLPDKNNMNIFTMWESSIVPKFPMEELNQIGAKIIVPSKWNEKIFIESGVKNIKYCPLFVDDEIFVFKEKKDLKKFTFCAGACNSFQSGNSKRKNFDIIFSAFRKAFKGIKDVELKFKISEIDRKKIGMILDDRISFVTNYLSDEKMMEFYSEADIFVSASKAEGWGFFQIESLAVGRPVITANFGGIKDFCTNENSFFVDFDEELADGGWGKRGGTWANIKEESLIEIMLYCYKNRDAIRQDYKKYSDSVVPKFGMTNFEKNLISLL